MRNKYFLFILFSLFTISFSQSTQELGINNNENKNQKIKSKQSYYGDLETSSFGMTGQSHIEKIEKNIPFFLKKAPSSGVSQILMNKGALDEHEITKAAAEAAGHIVTIVDDVFSIDVSGYDQIWFMNLMDDGWSSTEKTNLKTFLENGGSLVFWGVRGSFFSTQALKNDIQSFIIEVGGGNVSISPGQIYGDMTVQSNFRDPNNITDAYFPTSGFLSNVGNGSAIVKANSQGEEVTAAIWSSEDLGPSYTGKIALVMDITFLFPVNLNRADNVKFLENLITFTEPQSIPTIASSSLSNDNSYVDLTISQAVYNTVVGSGALEASDFTLVFAQNSGNATGVTISSIKKDDNTAEGSATALSGGETVVRVFLSITGKPSGVETVTITPTNGTSIYNALGLNMEASETTGAITLNDLLSPIITDVSIASDNSTITVTMSEGVYNTNGGSGALEASDFTLSISGGVATLSSSMPTSISSSGNVYTLGISLSDEPNGLDTLFVNPLDDSIYDGVGNEMAANQRGLHTPTSNFTLLNDLTEPTMISVSSSTPDGLYKIGEQIAIEVIFNESVVVTGTPQLTLETGATDAVVNYSSGSGSNTLVFNYTIASGDINSDLEYQSTSALALNGGTIKDATGNASILTLPTLLSANSLAGNKALVVDGVVPTLMQPPLTSIANNNTYIDIVLTEAVYNASAGSGALEVADFTLTFAQNSGNATGASISSVKQNDNVAEGSASALAGGEIVIRTFLSITGTPRGVETITITPVNATSIYDLAGNAMPTSANVVLTLNDQSAATITDVSFVGNRTIQATFSEAVFSNCNGGPLEADDFVISLDATYAHITINATPTILAVNGNIYTLAFTTTGNSYGNEKVIVDLKDDSVYDGTCNESSTDQSPNNFAYFPDESPPEISSVALATNNSSIDVTMSEASYNTNGGSGELEVSDYSFTLSGGIATLTSTTPVSISNNGSNVFTLGIGLTGAPNGQEVLTVNPVDNGIYDAVGNEAEILQTNNSVNLNDDLSPIITSVSLAQNNSTLAVTMSEAVYNTNGGSGALEASDFVFSINGGNATLSSTTPTSINNSGNVYTLGIGLSGTPNGAEVLVVNPIDDSIYDVTGNEASTSQNNNSVNLNSKVVPIITGITLASDNSSVAVTFSEAVFNATGGSGALEKTDFILSITGGNATLGSATPSSISSSSNTYTLSFSLSGTTNGNELLVVNPKDDSIYDSDNNEASTSQSNNAIYLNDNTVPTVTSVSSVTGNGTYGIGNVVQVTTIFSEEVFVTGTPQLALETGSTDAVVNYSSGSGSNTLIFNYTVAAGHISSDLDYLGTTSLTLNSGTIKDAAGNTATLTLASPGATYSLGDNKALVIDGNAPTITAINSPKPNGTYSQGDTIAINIVFSENVIVNASLFENDGTGRPSLTLETGSNDKKINYSSGSGNDTLTWEYIVSSGNNSSDLDVQSAAALALNGGTIKDGAGNNATLTLPTPGGTNSLSANKDLVIDTNGPTVLSVSSTTQDGAYNASDTIDVTVTFSETTVVTGNPQISLETGVMDGVGEYDSGSGTTVLLFKYAVGSNDQSFDLAYENASALILNAGTVKDAQGNNATLALPIPGESNSLSVNKAIVIDNIAPLMGVVVEGSLITSTDLDFQGVSDSLDLAWSGSDSISSLYKYEYALGTSSGGIQTIGWTNASLSTSITLSDLSLVEATTYFASVRATDKAGNVSAVMTGDGTTIDLLSPTAGTVNDGVGVDISYTSSLNTLAANWTGFTDATSGIADYQYAIGTTLNGVDVQDWSSNGPDTSFIHTGHNLINTQAYYVRVKAIDQVGNVSDTVSSNGVIADHENPAVGLVIRDKAFTNTDTLYASWSGFADSLSGITRYEYALGTSKGATDLVDWTDNGDSSKRNLALGILLKDASGYYVSVRAVDEVGNTSEVATSDVIIADFIPPAITSVYPEKGHLLYLLENTTIDFTTSEPVTNVILDVTTTLGASVDYIIELDITYAARIISVTINAPLISDDQIIIKIESFTDLAGNVINNLLYEYNVSILGDYDLDGDIGVTDLNTFITGWNNEDLSVELGPTVGTVPNLKPAPDNKYNSRDMMAFTRMWHWNTTKLSKQQTKIIADQGADLNAVIEADHIIFDPPKGTHALELILDYPASDIQFSIAAENGFSDEGLALSSVDTLNGRLVYQVGYFEANNTPIRISTKHLQKNDIVVNLTYQFIGPDNVILSAGSETMDITPVPSEFALHDNYPNPFNPVTTINYDLPKDAYVNLIIYDIMGREVVNLAGQEMSAGYQTMTWNARNNAGALVSAGIYFYQIQTRDFIKTKKMVLLK